MASLESLLAALSARTCLRFHWPALRLQHTPQRLDRPLLASACRIVYACTLRALHTLHTARAVYTLCTACTASNFRLHSGQRWDKLSRVSQRTNAANEARREALRSMSASERKALGLKLFAIYSGQQSAKAYKARGLDSFVHARAKRWPKKNVDSTEDKPRTKQLPIG